MSDYPAEASIAEILAQWNSAAKAGGGLSTKLSFKNVQGTIKNVVQATEKTTRRREKRWLHKATLTDETGEIKVALWWDQKMLLNNNDIVIIPNAEVTHFADWMNNNEGVIQVSNARGTMWKIRHDMQGFAICWPSDQGNNKILEFNEFLRKYGKLLWGVNWSIEKERLDRIVFPIKGYIYHKGEIIARAKITNFTEHPPTNLPLPDHFWVEIKSAEEILKRGLSTKGKMASISTENGKSYIDTGHGKKIISDCGSSGDNKTEFSTYDGGTFEFRNDELGLPKKIDLRSAGTSAGYTSDYKNYIHIEELELLKKPFPHKNLELFDDTRKMPDVIQQHVYVKELNHKSDNTSDDMDGESEMLKQIMRAAGEIEK